MRFLNVEEFCRKLRPVTVSEILTAGGEFHDEGLFSEQIFGVVDSNERRKTYSYIDLNCYILHPSAMKMLSRLDKKLLKVLSTEQSFILDSNGNIIYTDDGETGITAFIKAFPKIVFRGDSEARDKLIKVLYQSYQNGTLFINKLPIIPPAFRDAFKDKDGNLSIDPLNDYYSAILRVCSQIRSISSGSPLYDLLNFGVQRAVENHDDYIRSKIGKKQGLLRQQLLSKRVDFSARAVITPGPSLNIGEIGVPLRMAANLFEPFIIHIIMRTDRVDKEKLSQAINDYIGLDLSVDSIRKIIKAIKSGDDVPQYIYDTFFEVTELAMTNKVVLAKRDPTLQEENWRAYIGKLINGDTMQMSCCEVGGHGADFDGDTMALFVPLSNQAQKEAREKMMSALAAKSPGVLTFELSKDMYIGLFVMTSNVNLEGTAVLVSDEDLQKYNNPFSPVKYKGQITSSGRALVNSCLPKDFPFVNKQFNKKVVKGLLTEILRNYDQKTLKDTGSKLAKLGFKFATIAGSGILLDNLELPKEVYELKKKLDGSTTEEAMKLLDQMEKIVAKYLENTGLMDIIDSGAGKGWTQPRQILIAKGLITDPMGNILPVISSSFSDGLSCKQYFEASYGARAGISDRVLNTAQTGYMERKLVYVLNSVELSNSVKDCGTMNTIQVILTKDNIEDFRGRFVLLPDGRIEEFTLDKYKIGDVINLRSPIYCESKKICRACYGRMADVHNSPYIGILAGTILGERGMNLTMRSFHSGGAAQVKVRNVINDLVENDPKLNNI